MGSQVLGVMAVRKTGEPVYKVVRARVQDPLGMHDRSSMRSARLGGSGQMRTVLARLN
jgi:CubicO group peptidase (beta-lactamase class C family)